MIDPKIELAALELGAACSQSVRKLMRENGLTEKEIEDAFKGLASNVRFYIPSEGWVTTVDGPYYGEL
jgi:hypothetical protein